MEYALIIGVVAAAVLAMSAYAKRGIQSGIKTATDAISPSRWLDPNADPNGEIAQLNGIREESGDRQQNGLIGEVVVRESETMTTSRSFANNSIRMSNSSTTGSLAGRGAGASSYSEVIIDAQ